MAIKCIIIDDEIHGIITLEHHLKKIKDIVVVATTQDSTQAHALILQHNPDIVFFRH